MQHFKYGQAQLSLLSIPITMIAKRFHISIILLLAVSFLSAQTVQDRAKNKAEDKANNRVDTKIDQGLDKGFDAIEGLFKKKKKKSEDTDAGNSSQDSQEVKSSSSVPQEQDSSEINGSSDSMEKDDVENMYSNMFGGMMKPAKWEDNYTFDLKTESIMTSTNKRGKEEVSYMNMFISESAFAMEMDEKKEEQPVGFVIFDFENQSFITLNEQKGKKEGLAMAMNEEQISLMSESYAKEQESETEISFNKTGRSKTIVGKLAWEYEAKNEEGEGTMWMTEDMDLQADRFFGLFGESRGRNNFLPENYPEGYVLEMNFTDSQKGESVHYLVTSLDENANEKIDLGPYNVMDMQQMMKAGQR